MLISDELQAVTLHTNLGDVKCEIFCDEVPKTAEVCAVVFSLFSSICRIFPLFYDVLIFYPWFQKIGLLTLCIL